MRVLFRHRGRCSPRTARTTPARHVRTGRIRGGRGEFGRPAGVGGPPRSSRGPPALGSRPAQRRVLVRPRRAVCQRRPPHAQRRGPEGPPATEPSSGTSPRNACGRTSTPSSSRHSRPGRTGRTPRLDLAAGELPEPVVGPARALRDQDPASVDHRRADHLHHVERRARRGRRVGVQVCLHRAETRRRSTTWSTSPPSTPGSPVSQSTCSSTSVPAPVAENRRECVTHPRPTRPAYASRSGRTDTTSRSGLRQGRPSVRATSKATVSGASTNVVKRSWNTVQPSQTRQDGHCSTR